MNEKVNVPLVEILFRESHIFWNNLTPEIRPHHIYEDFMIGAAIFEFIELGFDKEGSVTLSTPAIFKRVSELLEVFTGGRLTIQDHKALYNIKDKNDYN